MEYLIQCLILLIEVSLAFILGIMTGYYLANNDIQNRKKTQGSRVRGKD